MSSETSSNLLVIGKTYPDKQSDLIVTGKLDYAADILPGEKLFTRMLTSPYAHANIKSIDVSKAMNLEGVKAVCTYQDCPVLHSELKYWGDRVAAVAATDPNIAEQATQLIEVQYEQLPFVIDPDKVGQEATTTPATTTTPAANEDASSPYYNPIASTTRGDTQTGFSQADETVQADVGWTAPYQHGSTEPRSATAYWVGDDLYVWTSTQNPFGFRANTASDLKMPLNKVHIRTHGTGNGHGDKNFSEYVTIAAVLSKKAGMPVGYYLSRFENFLEATHQYGVKATIKMGCKSDGTMVALDGQYLCDLTSSPLHLGGDALSAITQTYKCANLQASIKSVNTNKAMAAYWRCVGEPSGTFLFEQVVDMMAEKLGMDPLTFRLKNVVTRDMPDQDTGKPYGSVAVKECLQKAADAIKFSDKWHQPNTKTLSDGRMHGIGICCLVCSKGTLAAPRGAIVNVARDGTVLIDSGSSRASSGTNTAMCYIVAETLGATYDAVNVGDWGNTDVSSESDYQAGSTMTITLGAAFKVAADDAKSQLFAVAAGMLGVSADKLDAANNKIFEVGNESNSVSIGDVATKAAGPIIGRGTSWPSQLRLSAEAGFPIGTSAEVKTSVASAVEVAVDTETGAVEILNFVIADDMGRSINAIGTRNQIEGGMEIMHGQALLYEQIWDEANGGVCLGTNYLHHKWPSTLDLSVNNHQQIIVESIDSVGPYGAKGLGEPPVATYGSIQHAIYNAIGQWITDPPIYPQKILKALGKA